MSALPLVLEGSGLHAVVVGGGNVAARRAGGLLLAGVRVRVIAPVVLPALEALAAGGLLELRVREYAEGDLADADLVVAATDDRAVNASVAASARALHRLVNVADAPEEGTFVTPAVHRSGPLVVSVFAGGLPGAAVRIRDRVGERLDGRYGDAVARLAALRRALLDGGDAARWRQAARELLDERFCDAVERGELEARVSAWR